MDMNRTYSIIVLRGTQVRRFVVSQAGLRRLFWTVLLLLGLGALSLSDYVALQKKRLRQVIAKAQAQRERVSALGEKTEEVQELLSRWKVLQEKVQASLPRRHRTASESRPADEQLQETLGFLQKEIKQMIASLPSEWPVQGRIASGVGMRPSPWTGEKEFHSGLDIAQPIGTPVHAPGDGIVELVGESRANGRTIVLDHGQQIKTQYAHLSEILVKQGDRVRKGQLIALVGNTGKSTGPHLHYEVRVKGIPIDPRRNLIGVTPDKQGAAEQEDG